MCKRFETRGSLDARRSSPILTEAVDWTSFLEPDGGGELPAI